MLKEFEEISDVIYKKTEANCVIVYQETLCNIVAFMKDFFPRIEEERDKPIDKIVPGICKVVNKDSDLLFQLVFSGLLLVERNNIIYSFDLAKPPTRSIGDSNIESESPFSSRDGFVESFKINIALLRTRLKDQGLVINNTMVGRISKTNVSVLSIKRIHNKSILDNIIKDLDSLDVDAIITVDDLIEAFNVHGIFLGYQYVGSPDSAARRLLNGEFIIIIDRMSVALALPISVSIATRMPIENLNMPVFTVIERLFVFLCFFLSTIFLGILASFSTFQSDMLSLKIISIIKSTQEGVILPIGLEIIIIISIFELFYLICFRQAKALISGTILLIGGIIIGENLISSGIAGVFIITMVAISFLSGFVVSNNVTILSSISIVRLIFLISAFYFGIYGVTIASLIIGMLMYSRKLYGVNYFYPFIPFDIKGIYLFLLSSSSKKNNKRNQHLVSDNVRRRKE